MRRMKKYISILMACAILLPMASCSLKEDTSVIVSPYEFFNTPAQVRAGAS